MESQSKTHKLRIVKCPICWLLLPEPTDVAVYQCGGCHTVLQVKPRKDGAKSTASGSYGIDATKTNEFHHASSESISSSPNEILLSSGEISLDQNNGRDECISTDCSIHHASSTVRYFKVQVLSIILLATLWLYFGLFLHMLN